MRAGAVAFVVAAGMAVVSHAADRDRCVTGAAYGVAPGKSTGGLADDSLLGRAPGALMIGTSGRCYGWTRSGRLTRARCPEGRRDVCGVRDDRTARVR